MIIDRPPAPRLLMFTDVQLGMFRHAADVARRATMLEQIDRSPFADVVAQGIALAARRR